jgi:hypothetical protein
MNSRKYRSKLGSFLYKNEGLYQHILKDEVDPSVIVVLNYIKGTLFNIIPMVIECSLLFLKTFLSCS